MSDEQPSISVDRELTAEIVAAYVRRNPTTADQLGTLIAMVHQAIAGLGKPPGEPTGQRTPAVPIRRSVTPNFVVCLDCGWRGQMLKRHIGSAHGLGVDAYRARWSLPHDHAMTAPAYSERRSTMAKQLGLGRGGGMASVEASAPATPKGPASTEPRRRGRPRSRMTPT
jgi:predicted transcriptional regulator